MTDIEVLEREKQCVQRKAATNCFDCARCDLLMDDAVILAAYDHAISAIRHRGTMTKCHDLFDEDGGEIPLNAQTMTLDDAILHLDDTLSDTGRRWSCESCRLEHMQLRSWLAELRDIKQNQNEPLKLEELRKMDREPVWIKLFNPDEEFWVLRNEWVDTRNPEPMILFHMRWYSHADYGKTWLAYRQKPEEGTV